MVYITLTHTVEDFDKWKAGYDSHADERTKSGCKSGTVYTNPSNHKQITILFEWDSKENFQKFSSSESLKAAMMNAGVKSPPDVKFLE